MGLFPAVSPPCSPSRLAFSAVPFILGLVLHGCGEAPGASPATAPGEGVTNATSTVEPQRARGLALHVEPPVASSGNRERELEGADRAADGSLAAPDDIGDLSAPSHHKRVQKDVDDQAADTEREAGSTDYGTDNTAPGEMELAESSSGHDGVATHSRDGGAAAGGGEGRHEQEPVIEPALPVGNREAVVHAGSGPGEVHASEEHHADDSEAASGHEVEHPSDPAAEAIDDGDADVTATEDPAIKSALPGGNREEGEHDGSGPGEVHASEEHDAGDVEALSAPEVGHPSDPAAEAIDDGDADAKATEGVDHAADGSFAASDDVHNFSAPSYHKRVQQDDDDLIADREHEAGSIDHSTSSRTQGELAQSSVRSGGVSVHSTADAEAEGHNEQEAAVEPAVPERSGGEDERPAGSGPDASEEHHAGNVEVVGAPEGEPPSGGDADTKATEAIMKRHLEAHERTPEVEGEDEANGGETQVDKSSGRGRASDDADLSMNTAAHRSSRSLEEPAKEPPAAPDVAAPGEQGVDKRGVGVDKLEEVAPSQNGRSGGDAPEATPIRQHDSVAYEPEQQISEVDSAHRFAHPRADHDFTTKRAEAGEDSTKDISESEGSTARSTDDGASEDSTKDISESEGSSVYSTDGGASEVSGSSSQASVGSVGYHDPVALEEALDRMRTVNKKFLVLLNEAVGVKRRAKHYPVGSPERMEGKERIKVLRKRAQELGVSERQLTRFRRRTLIE